MVSTSIDLPKDLRNDVDDAVAGSHVYESRSHFIRVAVRKHLEDADDFTKSR